MGLRSKKSRLDQAADIVEGYVDSVRPHVASALETAKESTRDFVQDTAIPAFNDAKDKAGPALSDARDKAAPVVAEARAKAAAQFAEARERSAPVIAAGASAAGEKASAARALADAKVAELKGEEPKKTGKIKRLVLLGAVAGGVVFVAKKLRGDKTSDNWQSSYVPTPAPAAPAQSAAAAPAVENTEDSGGASPDEALADEAEAPHVATTPDAPVEVVQIDPEGDRE